jgi:methionine-rich copper-binding protein CopC
VLRRIARASLLSLLLLVVAASSAFAHECYNASRSEQGNTGAQHSDNWFNLTIEFVFTGILPAESGIELTPDQLAWALDQADAAGIPSSWVIRIDKTLGFNGKGELAPGFAMHDADGRGIDHAVAAYGDQLFGIFIEASQR